MTRKKVGDPFPDGKGYVDEGGGRESGERALTRSAVAKNGAAEDATGRQESQSAAANPAGHFGPVAWAAQKEDEIRALKVDLAYWKDVAETEESIRNKALEAANKELSAMLYELRAQRDYAIAIQEDRER